MNPTSKTLISLFLISSLLTLSANLYAKEKRGAKLIITKLDGQLIEGELIAVKKNSLLLLLGSVVDMSVDIKDIRVIKIRKKSRAGTGFLVGGSVGALIGLAFYKKPRPTGWFTFDFGPGVNALGGGIVGGLIGLVIGVAVGKDNTIQLEGMTDSEIKEALEKLRKKARIRDYK